jgi:hypothetical protein
MFRVPPSGILAPPSVACRIFRQSGFALLGESCCSPLILLQILALPAFYSLLSGLFLLYTYVLNLLKSKVNNFY